MDDTQHPEINIIPGACPHDCPDTCAWQVTVKDGGDFHDTLVEVARLK